VDKLVEIYEQSIGRGANLLLNIPPDRRGLIPDVDADGCASSASASPRPTRPTSRGRRRPRPARSRGGARPFSAARVNDGDPHTYWATAMHVERIG
jgi:alpha-L-fucosidase